MKRTMMSFVGAGALACAAPLALAQSSTDTQDTGMQHPQSGAVTHQPPYTTPTSGSTAAGSMSSQSQSGMSGSGMMMGEHSMSGTVESVSSDDMVSVKTGHGTLKLHFPNAAQDLKAGDTITVRLGYTKDGGSSSM